MSNYTLFKPLVWQWLDKISKGTNKDVVKQLLSGKGIAYTFDIPYPTACKMFENWKKERWINKI